MGFATPKNLQQMRHTYKELHLKEAISGDLFARDLLELIGWGQTHIWGYSKILREG